MDFSDIPPRKKAKVYCSAARRHVEITKWHRGSGNDFEEVGNPGVYSLICEEPWINVLKKKEYNGRFVHVPAHVPCGQDRYCSKLNELWAIQKNKDKKAEFIRQRREEIAKILRNPALRWMQRGGISMAEEALTKGNYADMVHGLYIAELGQSEHVKKAVAAISVKMKEIYNINHSLVG